MHADFITGWDRDFLQQAVNTCTNPSGRIEDCPLFNVVSQAEATSCQLDSTLPETLQLENVFGPAIELPGNVKITFGEGEELPPVEEPVPTTNGEQPTLAYTAGEKPTDPARPLPGQVFKESSKEAGAPAPTSAPSAPVAAAAAAAETTEAPEPTPSFYSTQYVTDGNTVSKILWEEELVYVTEYAEQTATVTAPANKRRRSHLHGHARRNV